MKNALLLTFMASVGKKGTELNKALVILLVLLIEDPNLEQELKV